MMGRSPCCSKVGLNRGAWTASEDKILTDYIKLHGEGKWRNLPKIAGLKRCGKSCRLRWLNYLRPDIKRGNISQDEEELIIRLHKLLGNRWSLIAGRLPGRTDNEIKNYWNTNLGKRLQDSRGNNNNTPVSNPKHSADYETFEKCKKKTKKIKAAQTDSNVVRTKALRCSKSFFTPQPQRVEHIDQLHRVPEKPKDVVNESPNAKPASESSGSPCWDSSFYPNQDNSPNFILNVDLGETVSLSDLFGSDFMGGVYDSGSEIITNRNKSNEMSTSNSSFDEPPHFSKEMLDHFSSIPEFWGDWLA